AIIEDDKIDAIVAIPDKMFYTTGIPASLWFIDMDKSSDNERKRNGETLFIDARELGEMLDRTHRGFSDEEDIKKIADTYHAYRADRRKKDTEYKRIAGFWKAANIEDIGKKDYAPTAGRYVGLGEKEDDGEAYEVKMERLTSELKEQYEERNKLQAEIKEVLKERSEERRVGKECRYGRTAND